MNMNFSLPKDLDEDTFKYLVESSIDEIYADAFIDRVFPNFTTNFAKKFEILQLYFNPCMISSYILEEQDKNSIAQSDYWFTLRHIINRAK